MGQSTPITRKSIEAVHRHYVEQWESVLGSAAILFLIAAGLQDDNPRLGSALSKLAENIENESHNALDGINSTFASANAQHLIGELDLPST